MNFKGLEMQSYRREEKEGGGKRKGRDENRRALLSPSLSMRILSVVTVIKDNDQVKQSGQISSIHRQNKSNLLGAKLDN